MNFGRVGFVMEGDWSAAVTYDTLSIVLYEGAVYAAKKMSAGSEPSTHPADWMLWVGSPIVSAEQTADGYDLTITNGDGTTSVVHLLNGQVTEAELTSALSGLREVFNTNIAEGYSSSSVYSEGDYCLYNNVLYRCKTDILSPEAWDSTHWEAASLADDVQDLSENLYNNKVDAITSTASGEIVTIADGGNNLPIKSMQISLLPVQSGSGDPSPDNIRPISGWTGVDVTHTGENLLGGVNLAETFRGCVSFALDTTAKTFNYGRSKNPVMAGVKWKPNTRYTFIWTHTASSRNNSIYIQYTDGTQEQFLVCDTASTKTTKVVTTSAGKTVKSFYLSYSQWGTVTVYYEESGIFEGVLTASDFVPYRGEIIPISWQSSAGTVYGGTVNPVTGLLNDEYDWAIADANGNLLHRGGSALSGSGYRVGGYVIYVVGQQGGVVWKSSVCNIYKTGTSVSDDGSCYIYNSSSEARMTFRDTSIPGWEEATNNAQLFSAFKAFVANQYAQGNILFATWKVTNPTTTQLSENQIATYLGVNNFWSNGNGSLDLEYRADTKLYIEQLTKPSEDDMTANANIASGRFFMVDNRLFLSTASIASGETIIPGTNCTEVSLADALNQINA